MPKVKRPFEYIALDSVQLNTKQGPAYAYFAVEAFTGYAFSAGVEPNDSPDTILKVIYWLTEQPEFKNGLQGNFTLVLADNELPEQRISNIIGGIGGKLLYHKAYCNHLINPVLESFLNYNRRQG